MRTLPQVDLSPCPPEFARLAGQGWDTVQEALAHVPTPALCDLLDAAQRAARDVGDDLEGVAALELNGQRFNVHATGAKGGFRWRLSNDDVILFVGSPKRDWTISVRYLSAGLWEHGWHVLRERVFKALAPYTALRSEDNVRVSRADWCFDFFAPTLADIFRPHLVEGVVCHSSAKAHFQATLPDKHALVEVWSRGARVETLTIGSKSGLQVQLYDKSLEITEASGKTWLYALWAERLGGAPWDGKKPFGMWRLECRFSGDFLKGRNIRRPDELEEHLSALIAEALYTRRLAVPSGEDGNRWRWPMHPIWSEAMRHRGASAMLPIGYKVTGRRDALRERAVKQIAGGIRSLTVLDGGDFDTARAKKLTARAVGLIESDPDHDKKVIGAKDRYIDVEEAR